MKCENCNQEYKPVEEELTGQARAISSCRNAHSKKEIEDMHYNNVLLPCCNRFEEIKPKRWKPEIGKVYWFFTANGCFDTYVFSGGDDPVDQKHLEFGNCFQSEDRAREAYDAIKKLLDELHEGWSI